MKYAIVNNNGVIELRTESIEVVPPGGIVLTDAQYSELASGVKTISNGKIITNPNPPKLF